MKKIILITMFIASTSFAQEFDINGGGGTGRTLQDINTGGRLVDDINTGGRAIELLNLERIEGTNNYSLKNARPKLRQMFKMGKRPDMVLRMMKLKIMADLSDISEITLKDGTVLKAEDIVTSE